MKDEDKSDGTVGAAVRRPILRYHGGKWRLAHWIASHFPPHRIYTEAFGGAASVLLTKPRSYAEVYNDLDGEIVNLFRVARDKSHALLEAIELTPFSRREFDQSFELTTDPIEQARRTIVRSFMGFGGNLTRSNRDLTPQRTGFRSYSKKNRRSIPAHDWRNWPASLPALIDRLRGVIIENREAIDVMAEHDGPETLHYVDPPYVHSTRSGFQIGSHRGYRFELSDEKHRELGRYLSGVSGMVVVSGYPCPLYDRELFPGWTRVERKALADGARQRVEVLWLSPSCGGLPSPDLFATRTKTT